MRKKITISVLAIALVLSLTAFNSPPCFAEGNKSLHRENYLVDTTAIYYPMGVSWSPHDPKLIAAVGFESDTIAVFSYDNSTKTLVRENYLADATAIDRPYDVSWSPHDPKLIAVVGHTSDTIAVFSYDNSTKALVRENYLVDATAIDDPMDVIWSPHDPRLMAVTGSNLHTIAVFSYDNSTKALVRENYLADNLAINGAEGVSWSPHDPKLIAAGGYASDTLAVFSYDNSTKSLVRENYLVDATAIDNPEGVSWSPHDPKLIAAVGINSDTVAVFSYDNSTKTLVRENYLADATAIDAPPDVSWSPHDPKLIAAVGYNASSIAVFSINQPPTTPTSWTNLGMNLIDHTPMVTWTKGTDNDGDIVTTFIYLGTTSTPTEIDGGTTGETFNLGENSSHSTYPLADGTTYYYRLRSWDGYDYSNYTTSDEFRMNTLPTTTNLKTEGQTNPSRITTTTPTFSWTYNDADEDNQSHWQIWVGTSSGTSDKWDSGGTAGADNSDAYDGSALSRGETYYIQVRTKDNLEWSDWTTGTFKINQLPTQTYSEQTFYMNPPYTPTLIWWFSDPDEDTQLGVKIQVDNDPGFGSLLWDYSDNTTTAQSKVYAGEALEKNVTYYARVQVRDGYEFSGTWSDNTFEILPIISLVVAEITVDSTPVDRKAHWAGDDDVRIYATVKDNEGRDVIENAYFWIRDNNDVVVIDNVIHQGYENIDENTKRFWLDYNPSDIMLDNALGEFDVKIQAVSVDFENTKDYTDLGFKLFTVNDHAITFSPVREIYAEGEIITFEPTVKSVASGLAVDNAYLKLELISELGEVLRTIEGYTDESGKLATHTTLLEADVGFYDVRISTSKGKIDGLKLYEDAFTVAAELLVSVESITPSDDAVSGLLRSRSIVPEDVVVKVKVFDDAGTELLDLTSDPLQVENAAPQLTTWEVPYGLTLAEGTYSYRVEVWNGDLSSLHDVAFAEVRLAVAPSQQAVGDWTATDTIETREGQFDVVLYRESIVTNPETVDKSNFLFRESIPALQGSTVMVRVSGLPATTLTVDQYGTITKYFNVPASTTVRIEMEVTITDAVKIEALGETEVVAAVPRTVMEYEYKVTNLTSTTLRELELIFPVSGVVGIVDEDGVPIVKFWETGSTAVEIAILEPYGEITLTLTASLAPSLPDIFWGLINWTVFGIPVIVILLVIGAVVAALTRKKTGPASKVILFILPLLVFIGLLALGVI